MKYKAIIVDLDGTAVDSPKQKTATTRLKKAVQTLRQHGMRVSVATGRSYSFAKPVVESMGIKGPIVVAGGAKIVDALSGDTIWSSLLSKSQVKQVQKTLQKEPYNIVWNDFTEDDYLGGGYSVDSLDTDEEIHLLMACFISEEDVKPLQEKLGKIDGITTTVVGAQKPDLYDLHISKKQATKEGAIYRLETMLGVESREMIAVGDGPNDVDLFEAVGYKVAMGNAENELKKAADKIIGDVKDDGLAEYLEELAQERSE